MRKLSGIPHGLVRVESVYSVQPLPSWQWIADYAVPEIVRCVSVSYVIAETAQAIAVAPNLGEVGCERIQASGIIRIPRSPVSNIADLR